MLLSLHVPKCAGTSFALILKRIFGPKLWLNYGAIFTKDDVREGIVPKDIACIHGHFEADAFDSVYPGEPMITWLRHPVERLASNYHYFQRHPGPNDHFSEVLNERNLSLVEFAELEGMQNVAARHFVGKPLDRFQFVGIAERFSESIEVFNDFMGVRDPGPLPQVNFNPERAAPDYNLSPSVRAHIASLNQTDLRLYDEACARLDRELLRIHTSRKPATRPKPRWTVI